MTSVFPTLMVTVFKFKVLQQVDMGEENENDVGGEENEEELFTVDNPSLDLEVQFILLDRR